MADKLAGAFTGTMAVQEKHQFDVASLKTYMQAHVEGFSGELGVEQFKGGQSNPTYKLSAGGKQYVLRRKPPGTLLASAHAVDREYRVMTALASTDVPVARTYCLCEDESVIGTPFYIMHRTDGRIPPDMPPYHMDGWLLEASPEDRAELWNSALTMMATLHTQDPAAAPLAQFISQHAFPKSLDEQLGYWERYMAWGLEGACNEDCEVALQWLRENQPAAQCQRLCWGDSRMANVIFAPDKNEIATLLDWEMLCMGDPLQDIAWWIFMDELFCHGIGIPRLEGFPSAEASAALWSSLTGLKHDQLHYYRVYAGLRISLILARMSLATDRSMLEQSFASQYTLKVMAEFD